MLVATLLPTSGTRVKLAALPPLALYIHLPWCVRKCPYCDFNSHALKPDPAIAPPPAPLPRRERELSADIERAYINALIADLEQALPLVWGRRVQTIFFGGGTPSLFSATGIDAILAAVRARLPVNADAEITLEANPGTFESNKFRAFRDSGINRLSIGVQSFNPRHLQALGRIHDATEAQRAIEIAHEHFDNFNIDLMYALPAQSLDEAEADIARALAANAPHMSFYHLTIEPNTVFAKYPPQVPDEDAAAEIHEHVEARLVAAGYVHYETSAYARPGRESRHNVNYWRFGDYLGIGAGAHSKISFADRITREARTRSPAEYMERVAAGTHVVDRKNVPVAELPFEFAMNALRLANGFAISEFTERTGLQISAASRALLEAEAKGLITRDHLHIRPTERGRHFLNDLLQLFLGD
ncbi:MAG: radical SAM family heme chaperone HemW [Burkholderiales bacterium]